MSIASLPITLQDVREAAIALNDVAVCTPLLESVKLNACLGGRLLIKAECSQLTGSFKLRGAYLRILNMTAEERVRGTITYSSGNHALGVTWAAQTLGTTALVVMPEDAPQAKMDAVRALGAEIETYNRKNENYDEVVERLRQKTGRIHVPPSAHPQVLAGAGTVALEIFEQAEKLGIYPDVILTPCGSGGLTASMAIVARKFSPNTKVYAVEPVDFDDTKRSLQAGTRLANPKGGKTICDAIMTPIPNEVTFPINAELLAGGLVVTDDDVRDAMRLAFDHFKIIVEPGAAVGIAAVLNQQIDISDKTFVTVITGGNINFDRYLSLFHQTT